MRNKDLMDLVKGLNQIGFAITNPVLEVVDFDLEWEFEAKEVQLMESVNVQSLTGKRKVKLEITFDEVN